jgi:hypothetical protein
MQLSAHSPKIESDMSKERKQLRVLLRRHEENLKLLTAHSESWRGEDRDRGAETLQNLTQQMERLLLQLKKRKGCKLTD